MCKQFHLIFKDRDNVDLSKVADIMQFVETAVGKYANTVELTFKNNQTVFVTVDDFEEDSILFSPNDLNPQLKEQIEELARWSYHMNNDHD